MLVWIFVVLTLNAADLPETYRSKGYATEQACESAKLAWVRELVGPVTIQDLGECRQVPRSELAPARFTPKSR